ncbi:phage holin family protein [Nonomuraea sp. SYSU D8015]|uniref:phage holin family protein n=1 Tax=Nonomuraea sp. SYSU D8015 TaxID=2593644 RepID=UPI00166025D1|nr:phage holin family protein [Nonomuraea sp. SYSU D8015]
MSTVQRPADGRPEAGRRQEMPSAGELIKQASEQVSVLVRQEIRLAVAEVKDKGRDAGLGTGLLGAAGMVALYGAAALVAAMIAALALVMPAWTAALIAAVVLLAVAAVLGLTGRKKVAHAMPPLPEQAIDSTRQDVTQIRESARR